MIDPRERVIRLIPPPGPLCWLHPEFWDFFPLQAPSHWRLDLAHEGLTGRSLLDRLGTLAPGVVEVERGPRGRTLWSWLARDWSVQGLMWPEPEAAPAPAAIAQAGPKRCPSLEALLEEATMVAGQAGTAILVPGPGQGFAIQSAVLSVDTAKEVAARSSGGDSAPIWLLPLNPGPGLESRIATCLERISEDPEPFQAGGLIPFFNTEPGPGADSVPVETRLPLSWWGILPGDHWPGAARLHFLELFRLLHPDRFFRFLAFENYALAGVDCYLQGLMRRLGVPRQEILAKRRSKALIVAICGIDGSGKSSHAAALNEHLARQGLESCVRKIYRHGIFHETVTDLTRLCANEKNLHLWRLQRIVKAFDSVKYLYSVLEKDLERHDVVIFDRYVFTHFAAGVGRYHHDPFTRELLGVYPEADRVFLLDLSAEEAMRRTGARERRTVDENPYMLSRYRHALLDLADRGSFMVLDGAGPFDRNQLAIRAEVQRILEARASGRGADSR